MQSKYNRSSPAEGVYFSRQGEHPRDLVRPIKAGALIVVTRLPGSKGRAINIILKELKASSEHFRGVDSASRTILWPSDPHELDMSEAQDNLAFVKRIIEAPDSTSSGNRPLLRVNVISGNLNVEGDMADNLLMVCRFLVPQVRDNLFTQFSSPKDGGVVSTVIFDLEVPDLNFDVRGFISDYLIPSNSPYAASVINFDTRAFDSIHLKDVYENILLPAHNHRLHRTGSFKKLLEEYGGNADLAMEIYARMSDNLGRDGRSFITFSEAFKAIEPRYFGSLSGQAHHPSEGR